MFLLLMILHSASTDVHCQTTGDVACPSEMGCDGTSTANISLGGSFLFVKAGNP